MKEIKSLSLSGLRLLTLPHSEDGRGAFIKTFHQSALQAAGIDFNLKESYYSFSKKDVIRGMHFQLPPHQHAKIVFCPVGEILDVALDLRRNSPTYGQHLATKLSRENHQALYIPEGFAHGFKALTDGAMTYYLVSSGYHPASDTGIRFDSFGMDWQVTAPVMSERDKGFVTFQEFESPF